MTFRQLRERLRDRYGCEVREVDLSFAANVRHFYFIRRWIVGRETPLMTTLAGTDSDEVPRAELEAKLTDLRIPLAEFGL